MKKYTESEKEKHKEKLKQIIGKKFETITIYPLAQAEQAFGEIFGIGKPLNKLTDSEKMYREKWERFRESILNTGNHQKRNALKELDLYSIEWQGYQTEFLVNNR